MKRKQEKERYDRLSFKTLVRQFQQEAIDGLSCSPLEAKVLIKIVKEVYLEKKDPVQVERETDHSPEAVGGGIASSLINGSGVWKMGWVRGR
ncbi:hypothetical protein C5S36_00875 [Candidatus Methanophagaceae archaeon]|nr:hypothetical protein C5S36_00875 [Methanophagales archaeon]